MHLAQCTWRFLVRRSGLGPPASRRLSSRRDAGTVQKPDSGPEVALRRAAGSPICRDSGAGILGSRLDKLPAAGKNLDPRVRKLRRAGKNLEPCVRKLRRAGRNLEPCVRKLRRAGRNLEPCVRKLRRAGRNLDSSVRKSSEPVFVGTWAETERSSVVPAVLRGRPGRPIQGRGPSGVLYSRRHDFGFSAIKSPVEGCSDA